MAGPTMTDKLKRTKFLGTEFLTWLLYHSATDEGVFTLEGGKDVQVIFERSINLEGDNPAREMTNIKVDDPTESMEVMLSLRLGKKVACGRILIVVEGKEYSLVLDASALSLRSVKLPDVIAGDLIESWAEKAEYTAELEDIVHGLFLRFVRLKMDQDAWTLEVSRMSKWIGPWVG